MDHLSEEKRSENMSHIKSKETTIEIAFRKKLWMLGFRYSKNSGKYFGKPDLVLPKLKDASKPCKCKRDKTANSPARALLFRFLVTSI